MSIINVSGRINSGKDETGKIIQYLTSESSNKNSSKYRSYSEFKKKGGGSSPRNFDHHYQSSWQIKKYATKLKQIVAILLGCTEEDLEDREFKEGKLGDEWNYKMVYDANWNKQWTAQSPSYETKSGTEDKIHKRTPRSLLQLIGTELFRDQIHPDVWVNALFADYKPTGEFNTIHDATIYPNWIITDSRFPNDTDHVTKLGGINIRVVRNIPKPEFEHFSEKALDDYKFDHVIQNDGTLEDLIEKVREMLIKEKII